MRNLAGTMAVLRRIVDLALIGLIIVVLFGLFLGKLVPLTGHQTIIIGGSSMEPAIHLGSAIVIGPVAPEDLAEGDMVSLQVGPNRTTFTHRIVAVVPRPDGVWVRTKGDANADPDPTLVPATSIVGRVEWSVPWAGYLLALLSLPVGVIFALGLAATLFAIAWLLESLESDADLAIVHDAPESGGDGEPIPARPGLSGSVFPANVATPGPSVETRTGALPSFGDVARPTVAEHLARSRANRARHNRWLVGRQLGRPRAE
jgi:signal peptidase